VSIFWRDKLVLSIAREGGEDVNYDNSSNLWHPVDVDRVYTSTRSHSSTRVAFHSWFLSTLDEAEPSTGRICPEFFAATASYHPSQCRVDSRAGDSGIAIRVKIARVSSIGWPRFGFGGPRKSGDPREGRSYWYSTLNLHVFISFTLTQQSASTSPISRRPIRLGSRTMDSRLFSIFAPIIYKQLFNRIMSLCRTSKRRRARTFFPPHHSP
jgi:hypothetical protein